MPSDDYVVVVRPSTVAAEFVRPKRCATAIPVVHQLTVTLPGRPTTVAL